MERILRMWLVLLNGKDCFVPAGRKILTNSSCVKPRGSTCFHKMRASAPTSCGRRTSRQSGFQQGRSSRNEKPVLLVEQWSPHVDSVLQRLTNFPVQEQTGDHLRWLAVTSMIHEADASFFNADVRRNQMMQGRIFRSAEQLRRERSE
jgi:hypothetical protein